MAFVFYNASTCNNRSLVFEEGADGALTPVWAQC